MTRRNDNLIGAQPGQDGYVRMKVRSQMHESFQLLNLHTHGDEHQGRILADAQYHLAQVRQLMDDIDREAT